MMAQRPFVLSAVLAPLALLVTGCGSTEKFRYKMTVEVETPQGTKTGYAVREVTHSTPPSIPMLGESRPTWSVVGEAVAVDLPDGQTLFALLTNGAGDVGHAGTDMWFLFRELGQENIELWPNPPRTERPRIDNAIPMLVRFARKNDPTSVEQVSPNEFGARFGAGIRLKRIAVEKTTDDVTVGIDKLLPSFGPETGFDQWYKKLSYGDPRAVGPYDFKRGSKE